jgi:hypothetical protein
LLAASRLSAAAVTDGDTPPRGALEARRTLSRPTRDACRECCCPAARKNMNLSKCHIGVATLVSVWAPARNSRAWGEHRRRKPELVCRELRQVHESDECHIVTNRYCTSMDQRSTGEKPICCAAMCMQIVWAPIQIAERQARQLRVSGCLRLHHQGFEGTKGMQRLSRAIWQARGFGVAGEHLQRCVFSEGLGLWSGEGQEYC